MRLVLDHLRDNGAQSVASVGSLLTNSSTEQRLAGFRRRSEELCMTIGTDAVLLGQYSVEWGEAAATRLIDGRELPDAVVCGDIHENASPPRQSAC